MIVSCGLLNFEESAWSNQSSKEVKDYLATKSNDVKPGCLDNELLRKLFVESFKANFPELCRNRNIIVIDCTKFVDPDKDKSLRGHRGSHPETLRGVAEAENFLEVNEFLQDLDRVGDNLVINVCKVGRHRSVCLLHTSPSPRDGLLSRMPSSA